MVEIEVDESLSWVLVIVSVVGVLAVMAASISVATYRPLEKFLRSRRLETEFSDLRLGELRQMRDSWQLKADLLGFTAALLTFGRYVVGSAIASSPFTDPLPDILVLALGVTVIISTSIQKHMQPGERALSLRRRTVKLNGAIREAEDAVFESGPKVPKEVQIELRRRATQVLTEVESDGLMEFGAADKN